MTQPKLKIGLIIDGEKLPLWLAHIFDEVQAGDFGEVTAIFLNDKCLNDSTQSENVKQGFSLFSYYSKLEERLTAGHPVFVNSRSAKRSNIIKRLVVPKEKFKENSFDVILNFSECPVEGELLSLASAGIWALKFGHSQYHLNSSTVGFWEKYQGEYTINCTLFMSCSDGTNKPLYNTQLAAGNDPFKIVQATVYWSCTPIILRKLKKLQSAGLDHVLNTDARLSDSAVQFESESVENLGIPDNWNMSIYFMKKIARSLRMRVTNLLSKEQWMLMYSFQEGLTTDCKKFKPMALPERNFWADPFIIYKDETYYVYFEDYLYGTGLGHLSVLTIDKQGNTSEPKPCLVRPYHLSYPFVFEWQDQYFMIPETKGSGAIECYVCERFPDKWKFHSYLMKNVEAVDTTLFPKDGKWWMFTNIKENRYTSVNNNLSIFYADSPLSQEWTPHKMNPVISDVRRARQAGRIFMHEDKIVRPAQDASVRYGYGIRLHEIIELSEDQFTEKEMLFIEPDWQHSLCGTHTLAYENDLTIIDVERRRWIFSK